MITSNIKQINDVTYRQYFYSKSDWFWKKNVLWLCRYRTQFSLIISLFKRLQLKHTWKILKIHGHVNEHLFNIFFTVNLYSCGRGNKTSKKYQMDPPSLVEYLNVTANDRYDGLDDNEYMMEFLERDNL